MYSYTEIHDVSTCWRALAEQDARVYKKGTRIPDGAWLYYVLKGCVRLTAITSSGEEKIIWYLRDNTIFNETPVFSAADAAGAPLPPSFAALCPRKSPSDPVFAHFCTHDSLVGRIPLATAIEAGRRNPDLFLCLCRSFALKVTLLVDKMTRDQISSTRQRVFGYLANRLENAEEPALIRLENNFQDIANYLAIHRISLYKILEAARKEGLLDYCRKGKTVRILDMAAFLREANRS